MIRCTSPDNLLSLLNYYYHSHSNIIKIILNTICAHYYRGYLYNAINSNFLGPNHTWDIMRQDNNYHKYKSTYYIISDPKCPVPDYDRLFTKLNEIFRDCTNSKLVTAKNIIPYITNIVCALLSNPNLDIKIYMKCIINILYYSYGDFLKLSNIYCSDVLHYILMITFRINLS